MAIDENLTKIYIDLPAEDEGFSGESLWAKPLGDDLYEIRNSPWYAYDLHFLDIVRAIPDDPREKPRIREVVRHSGHRTLRVFFNEKTTPEENIVLLKQLNDLRAFFEQSSDRFFAIDIEPAGDYQAVCDTLWRWEQEGILVYETGVQKDPI